MDHYTRIQLAIEYLEQHLQDDFNIRETSAAASFSAFHFQRLFQAITGFTVLEYVRRRRLTEAAGLLRDTSQGILDIAMSFGYQSQEAFTRAFSAYFGMTPAKLRKLEVDQLSLLKMQQSIDFNDYRTRLDGTFYMNTPRLVTREPNWIFGYEYKTNLNDNQHYAEIPGFYHDFGMEQKFMAIPERTRPDMAYGVACHLKRMEHFLLLWVKKAMEHLRCMNPVLPRLNFRAACMQSSPWKAPDRISVK